MIKVLKIAILDRSLFQLLLSTSVSFQMSVQRCYLQSTLTTLLQMTKQTNGSVEFTVTDVQTREGRPSWIIRLFCTMLNVKKKMSTFISRKSTLQVLTSRKLYTDYILTSCFSLYGTSSSYIYFLNRTNPF